MSAGILGVGAYLPERLLTNDELASRFDVTPDWIFERTGIRQRHIAAPEQACSDLAIAAARQALENSSTTPDEIGMVIVATLTADYITPATAAIVQNALGIPAAICFDLSAACTGFVYGLMVGCNAVSSGLCRKVLLIGAELLSRTVNPLDRDSVVLFGDGAGAVVIGNLPEGYGLLATDAGASGAEYQAIMIPAGGSRLPASDATIAEKLHYVRMDGMAVFMFAMRVLGESVLRVTANGGLSLDDVALIIPHQANRRIIEAAFGRLDLPLDKVMLCIEQSGNTSAASIPLALDSAVREGRIRDGDRVALAAFGGGVCWGSALLRWRSAGERP